MARGSLEWRPGGPRGLVTRSHFLSTGIMLSSAVGVPCRGSFTRALLLPRYHIAPERLDRLGRQYVTPGRHLIFPAQHRGDEAFALVSREFTQIEGALWVQHAGAVAWRAMARIDVSAGGELLRREALPLRALRLGRHAHAHSSDDEQYYDAFHRSRICLTGEAPVGAGAEPSRVVHDDCPRAAQSWISAKVQTEPPWGT